MSLVTPSGVTESDTETRLEDQSPDDLLIGRRQSTRYPVRLSGRFIGGGANIRIWIDDISLTGAEMRLMVPRPLTIGRLLWLGFEQHVDVVWQNEARCGLQFADRLPPDWLRQTLDAADLAAKGSSSMRRLAAAWVHGPGDY